VHKTGIGITGGYDRVDEDDANKSAAKGDVDVTKTCSECKEPGHLRPSNTLCKYCVPRKKKPSEKKKSLHTAMHQIAACAECPHALGCMFL